MIISKYRYAHRPKFRYQILSILEALENDTVILEVNESTGTCLIADPLFHSWVTREIRDKEITRIDIENLKNAITVVFSEGRG